VDVMLFLLRRRARTEHQNEQTGCGAERGHVAQGVERTVEEDEGSDSGSCSLTQVDGGGVQGLPL
jgi:hypothetical protein